MSLCNKLNDLSVYIFLMGGVFLMAFRGGLPHHVLPPTLSSQNVPAALC